MDEIWDLSQFLRVFIPTLGIFRSYVITPKVPIISKQEILTYTGVE